MQGWRIVEHGAPLAALRFDDAIDAPSPAAGQVAVAVVACGLNFADTLLCAGTYQERPPLPATPGMEVAGVVSAVGDGVAPSLVGQRVTALAALPHGGLAEVCVAAEADAWPVPDGVDDVVAASLPITYGTAWIGLFRRGEVWPGDTVLVHAAAGGTGSAAVQLAKAGGATVLATAGGPDKVALARRLGADHAWDSRADGFDIVDLVRSVTDGRGVDVVFDPVGGDLFDASRRVVAFEGRYLVVGNASGRVPTAPTNHVLVKGYSIVGVHLAGYRRELPDVVAEAQAGVATLLAEGRIAPLVDDVRPLAEAAAALDDLANRRTTGKVVITVR